MAEVKDWNFKGCDTRFGIHGIHTYVAAMIPQLARRLIDMYAPCDGTVLDPFCGGGSVMGETVRSGRTAIGRDVNELAVLITKAKTTHIPKSESISALDRMLSMVNGGIQLPLPLAVDKNLAYWFKPEHLTLLYSLRHSIASTIAEDSPMLPLFLTVFSATARDVMLTYRNEIRLRRMSPEEVEKFDVDPIMRFQERAKRAIADIEALPCYNRTNIKKGTAQAIELPDKSVSAIVCSPPYGDERNGVSYSQFSKNMLACIGHSPDTIKQSKGMTLGWGNSERAKPTSDTLAMAIAAIGQYPNSIKEAVAFYADYQVALKEMARVTSGHIVIVIGKRVLRDTIFDNGEITIELMQNIGVPLKERHCRTLPTKRLPKMRKFGAAINREDILVFSP